MSYDIYYSIRENIKTKYYVNTLFYGKKKVFDYKNIEDMLIFDTYNEAILYMRKKHLLTSKYHIRKTISTNGGITHKDYITKKGFEIYD